MGRRLGVDDEIGQAALDHVDDPGDCISGDGVDERIGPAEVVSGGYDVVHCEESVGGVGRFLLENVEAGPGDPFIPKRGDQRFLVNDRAARDIDEIGGRLHQCETSRIQQMPRLLVEKARDDDKVRALHQLFKAAEFNADISCGRRTDMGIGRQGFVTPAVACWMYVRAVAEGMRKNHLRRIWVPARGHKSGEFTLSFRDIEDLLAERGIAVSYETVRRWVKHFGPMIAAQRKRRPKPMRPGILTKSF
jgi:hypothetical protein